MILQMDRSALVDEGAYCSVPQCSLVSSDWHHNSFQKKAGRSCFPLTHMTEFIRDFDVSGTFFTISMLEDSSKRNSYSINTVWWTCKRVWFGHGVHFRCNSSKSAWQSVDQDKCCEKFVTIMVFLVLLYLSMGMAISGTMYRQSSAGGFLGYNMYLDFSTHVR